MNSVVYLADKVKTLREFETYCYQIAFYILQSENFAIEATRNALIELSMDDEFFKKPPTVQQQILKRTSMNKAIAIKQNYEKRVPL